MTHTRRIALVVTDMADAVMEENGVESRQMRWYDKLVIYDFMLTICRLGGMEGYFYIHLLMGGE